MCLLTQGYLEETNEEEQAAGRPEEEATAIVGHQDQPPLARCAASKLASVTLWLTDDTCVLSKGVCVSKGEKQYMVLILSGKNRLVLTILLLVIRTCKLERLL